MCTLTYLPLEHGDFIVTSNRDEQPSRATLAPETYEEDGVLLTYPKDVVAGGTWIGTSSMKRLVCLLNGGFKAHKRAAVYAKSRGLVVKELLKVSDVIPHVEVCQFTGMEPFTMVLLDWSSSLRVYELVWDGAAKHFKKLPNKPCIWSSSMLYSSEVKQQREQWFATWLKTHPSYDREAILDFHQDTQKGAREHTLRMERSAVETISITSAEKSVEAVSMTYLCLV